MCEEVLYLLMNGKKMDLKSSKKKKHKAQIDSCLMKKFSKDMGIMDVW